MKSRITAAFAAALIVLSFAATAGAQGPAPISEPFASYTGVDGFDHLVSLFGLTDQQVDHGATGTDTRMFAGTDVLLGQARCQEQCTTTIRIDGAVVVGPVAGAATMHTAFAAGTHTIAVTVTTSKKGAIASSSTRSLVLTAVAAAPQGFTTSAKFWG